MRVILGRYTFSEYEFATRLMGGKLVVVDPKDWREDLSAMAEAVKRGLAWFSWAIQTIRWELWWRKRGG